MGEDEFMNLNIAQKIFGIALVVLALMLVVAVYSVHLAANISDELDAVANQHLPVSEAATRVNLHVVEQAVVLQELFVLIEAQADEKELAAGRAKYEAIRARIIDEFESVRRQLKDEESAPQTRAAIIRLERALTAIEDEYKTFEARAEGLITLRNTGDLAKFNSLLPALDARQEAVDDEIAALRRHISDLTVAAVFRADRDEKKLLFAVVALTALATLLSITFALIVTRILVRTVRDLVAGTEAVEKGDLDTEVPVSTNDEIGRLTGAFNHMVGELRLKERIKDTFGKYMDPRIVSNLLDHPEFAEPGGERREMTVMFIDLKGFTSISEALSPDDLVNLINCFFGHMADAIADNKGVVDKFMGDAVMAYWGPPFSGSDDHALLACRAAAQALDHLEEFRDDVRSELGAHAAGIEIDLRIGVSTGEMIVGTVGSKASKNFTIMGDPVNLGSRLEGANKAYGTRALISERTRALAGDDIIVRELDLIRVKGKKVPTRVYELLKTKDNVSVAKYFQTGLTAYRNQDWGNAEIAFKACLEADASDPPAAVYLDRVAQLRAHTLPIDWDGVWNFDTK
jgi:class 3 adenylate cyclase